jgi:hypothetical protein
MSDTRVAHDPDRLPWLTEVGKPRRKSDRNALLLWALLAALLVGGVAYWFGMQSVTEADESAKHSPASPPAATITLPQPAIEPQRAQEVQPSPVPEVRPVPEPVVSIPRAEPVLTTKPHVTHRAAAKPEAATVAEKTPAPAPVSKPAVAKPAPLKLWPASVSEGASGRVVRIGAYGSRHNAKKGWWQVVHRYPGMRRLRAVVAPVPAPRTGKIYYRLQFGTTSQAHSEVLCQRMRAIRKTCAVVGLQPRPSAAQGRGGVRR